MYGVGGKKETTSKFCPINENIFGVLKVYAVCVWAVTWGRDGHVVDQHTHAVVELEVALWAVLDLNARHSHVKTTINT